MNIENNMCASTVWGFFLCVVGGSFMLREGVLSRGGKSFFNFSFF